jgi:hypothetical protein
MEKLWTRTSDMAGAPSVIGGSVTTMVAPQGHDVQCAPCCSPPPLVLGQLLRRDVVAVSE